MNIQQVTGAWVGEVQATFREIYNLGPDFPVDGSQFDLLLDEGKRLGFGSLEVEAPHTPVCRGESAMPSSSATSLHARLRVGALRLPGWLRSRSLRFDSAPRRAVARLCK